MVAARQSRNTTLRSELLILSAVGGGTIRPSLLSQGDIMLILLIIVLILRFGGVGSIAFVIAATG